MVLENVITFKRIIVLWQWIFWKKYLSIMWVKRYYKNIHPILRSFIYLELDIDPGNPRNVLGIHYSKKKLFLVFSENVNTFDLFICSLLVFSSFIILSLINLQWYKNWNQMTLILISFFFFKWIEKLPEKRFLTNHTLTGKKTWLLWSNMKRRDGWSVNRIGGICTCTRFFNV